MGERIELSEHDLKKVAGLMADEINCNIDAHITEALEIHRIEIDKKYDIKIKEFKEEASTAILMQNEAISFIKADQINVWKEINLIKDSMPIVKAYVRIRKIAFWLAIGIVVTILLVKCSLIE